jgi:hypothetical protein
LQELLAMKRLKPKSDSVVADVVENEAVIINVETGIYYSTEGAGGWIWSNVAVAAPCDAMRSRLVALAGEEAGLAFDAFVGKLHEEGLVVDAESGAEAPLADPACYEAPELIVYRDMKDLMALDPPMPILDEKSAA